MKFFKTFLAALLAVFVGFGFIVMMWTLFIVGMVAAVGSSLGSSSPAVVHSGSILKLDLGVVTDKPASSMFEEFDFVSMQPARRTSLLKTVQAIQAAASDNRIEGIYINFDEKASVSLSSLEEIRAELVKFKATGKFIVAYQEYWSQIGYWFASVADKIYTNPSGGLQWQGLSAQLMFYKGLLDRLDIEPVVVRHGDFKSAVEPFINEKMSPENRTQYETLLNSWWGFIVDDIASSRGVDSSQLQKYADELGIDSPKAALGAGMIDGIVYEDEAIALMGARMSSPTDEPRIVSFGDYASQVTQAYPAAQNRIAVIYAEGEIASGSSSQGMVGSASMIERLKQVREDEGVKAVVLRINSPGGSALAAEVMWHELELLKAAKPVIVSMGSMAASGGYYIAAPGDAIFALRSTLTGSIGVFGLFANVGDALQSKLGVTTDVVRTNRYSDLGSIMRTPSAPELAYFRKQVEDVYATFTGHVADGRNMTVEAVDKIGQGRVWSGVNALDNGLVDGMGGLVDAISLAAERVGIQGDFRIDEVTDTPTGFEALFGGISTRLRSMVLRDEMGEVFVHYESLRRMLDTDEVQARMPYSVDVR